MKTVSVALVLCLNVGVDPPDVVKISPCARLECWIGKMYIIFQIVHKLKAFSQDCVPFLNQNICCGC